MNVFLKYLLAFITIVILCAACSKYQRLLKSDNLELKYEAAIKYYEEKQYYKAYPLLEELIAIFRGTARAEKLYYYYANSDFELGDYMSAALRYNNFTKTYPNSQYAEECAYMSALCYYLSSPFYSLDQTDTKTAINELQLFMDRYPKSNRMDTCNFLMDKLQGKLERKAYEIAKQYLHTKKYKSSAMAFNNLIHDFPGTRYREESVFLILKSNYLLAFNSIETKKQARLKDTVNSYVKFAAEFPKSRYMKDAESIYRNVLKEQDKSES